jgi:hypothetical protein
MLPSEAANGVCGAGVRMFFCRRLNMVRGAKIAISSLFGFVIEGARARSFE